MIVYAKKLRGYLALGTLVAGLSACAPQPTVVLDAKTDRSPNTMGLDSRDFESAASRHVQKMLTSGALHNPRGGRYVVTISRMTNDTMQRIDTDQLIKIIRVELLNSGKVVITTAVGGNGPEDTMSLQARQLRASAEFNQSTVAKQGQMIAPDFSLSGKIIQQNNRVDGGAQRVDYEFMLTLTDIKTGLAFWEGTEKISKLGSGSTASW